MLKIAAESDLDPTETNVLFFHADWCGPCKRMEPTVEKLATEFQPTKFYSVDVEEASDMVHKYSVRSIPVLLVMRGGEVVNRVNGLSLIEPLRKMLRDL